MRKVFPVFAIVLGLFWIVMAFEYGLWIRRGPGGGFFPIIGGILTVLFGVSYLKNEIMHPVKADFSGKFLYPVLALLGTLVCSYVLGLVPCMFLFIFLWLWKYEKYPISFSFYVAFGTMFVLYMVFVYWLSVPLPLGKIGDAVMNWYYAKSAASAAAM